MKMEDLMLSIWHLDPDQSNIALHNLASDITPIDYSSFWDFKRFISGTHRIHSEMWYENKFKFDKMANWIHFIANYNHSETH